MKKNNFIISVVLIGILISLPTTGITYQAMEVKNGGIIRGKAVLTGKLPEPRIFHLVLSPNMELCASVDTDENMNRLFVKGRVNSYQCGGLKVYHSG